ncbi:MAG: YncE family protein [Chitinophagaceae bacterium]
MSGQLLTALFFLISTFIVQAQSENVRVLEHDLKYCESTFWNANDLYVANFGSTPLNPLNKEGKGYITQYKEGKTSILIPADGNLNAPKGMALKANYLFIADVNIIVVYNLTNLKEKPQKIVFPKEDVFVNDLSLKGNTLYATVTNTGNVYTIDVSKIEILSSITPVLYTNIPGANGILLVDDKMYVASYNPIGTPTSENVIYVIPNIKNPKPIHFIHQSGQYDGLAISKNHKTLYFSDWVKGRIGSIDMNTKKLQYFPINLKNPLIGPADITLKDNYLYIPDLPNSRVIVIKAN